MLYFKTFKSDTNRDWVVFIHGAGGSSVVWYKQIQSYRKHFNLLLIDLRGHGRSADGPTLKRSDYSFESIALDVIEVMDHLHIRQAHFVGVSLGTIIIRQLAEMKSEYVKSMIMVGAITRMNLKSRFFVRMGQIFHNVMPFMWLYKIFAFIIMPLEQHEEARNVFIREARKLARKAFIRWFMLTRNVTSKLKFLEEKDLGIPTLYVMGEQDHMFLEPIRKLVDRFKSQSLKVVDKCGHVVNIEKAGIFNEISIQYLKEQPASWSNQTSV